MYRSRRLHFLSSDALHAQELETLHTTKTVEGDAAKREKEKLERDLSDLQHQLREKEQHISKLNLTIVRRSVP